MLCAEKCFVLGSVQCNLQKSVGYNTFHCSAHYTSHHTALCIALHCPTLHYYLCWVFCGLGAQCSAVEFCAVLFSEKCFVLGSVQCSAVCRKV